MRADASPRAIVIHPAEYVSRAFRLRTGGWVGRSYGCPALDPTISGRIIDRIRAGSLLYAGGPS
ncbi:MAG: murein L,D-transpeptidase catalytic domain-containing protein [Myxococcota bacterium]